tara:strand:+ start:185 stop:739 length:555 start_codon:yes stop_codon:yes gene_type:complete
LIFETLAGAAAALSAVNSTIDVLKQSKANAQDVGKLLASFGEAAGKLDSYEAKTKKKRPLTPKEAMQLSLHRRQLKAKEREIQDICLMAGCAEVYHESIRLRRASEREHAEFLKTAHLARKKRKEKIKGFAIAFFIVISMGVLGGTSYLLYDAYQDVKLQNAKERLKALKQRQANIRRCGRPRC